MSGPALHSIVAFLDILGFRALIAARIRDTDFRHTIDQILRSSKSILGGRGSLNRNIRTRMFSDCVCISARVSPRNVIDLLFAVACYQRNLANACIFTRGGIAMGLHFQTSHLIFSEGLVNAYSIESTVARVPRIVGSPAVVDYARAALGRYRGPLTATAGPSLSAAFEHLFWTDKDDEQYVNYLSDLRGFDMVSSMFQQAWSHKRAVERWVQKGVSQGLTESRAQKFRWLIEYHNKAILPFAEADDFLVDAARYGL
jgi:hypothetical protein